MLKALDHLKALDANQRRTVIASFLGWTLDAFDFFILVFVVKYIAQEFNASIPEVSLAIFLTLVMRPVGALIFGIIAEKFGRRTTLMIDVLMYSVFEFASGFAPSLGVLIVLRIIYGIAMGGEWGVGASLTMESIPKEARGVISGILQAGYPFGYLLASLVFFLLFPVIGWRGMFMVGAIPALLVFYIRRNVSESPVYEARDKTKSEPFLKVLRQNAKLFIWAVIMMTAFNLFSHGSQDVYPTFMETQRNYSTHVVGAIAIFYNIGAILGGIVFGQFSQLIGRKRAIVIAAVLAVPTAWLWAFAPGAVLLAIGAFLMQFFVQGAWGVIPVHLNELSPDEVRSTFPGFAYQMGNLIAAGNATLLTSLAAAWGNDYASAMFWEMIVVAILVALLAGFGYEKRNVSFGAQQG
ncbi:MFS transporter [Acidimangrovimonas sediminis]|uniref:MFS transporter n=1 Tax=Acidimangrovimonas sediminis TaxID=2056283 RepID=UPI000C807182|nr:MFS transporter [Acidimangrovimonas sediminis]